MTHTYHITGITCSGCVAKVQSALEKVPEITNVEVSKEAGSARITMNKHVSTADLQAALDPRYSISMAPVTDVQEAEETRSWLETYKPILLIFAFIGCVTVLIQFQNDRFNPMEWMRHFMAGFFLVFSFFKLLNLKGFSESYAMYDVIAKRIPFWGVVYAFIELGLGISYLVNWNPQLTNWITLIVMSISIIGVLKTVLNKKKIRCACLGTVFNLPMSTVTIIEDALMIAMSAAMLFLA
ncbi:MauE/DoxX family redox-associated membrane protein [Fluviicola sp.]|uniref:heavy-metal-associated domain-containing protein n=1 Tax=Fluviicola sp. TaxID=1917219 RepID=UPI0031E070A4